MFEMMRDLLHEFDPRRGGFEHDETFQDAIASYATAIDSPHCGTDSTIGTIPISSEVVREDAVRSGKRHDLFLELV
jgi:hypothetical protein